MVYRDYFSKVERISQGKKKDDLFNACKHCQYQIEALRIIKNRYDSDVQELLDLQDKHNQIMDKVKQPNEYLTPRDRTTRELYFCMQNQLRLDQETYIIFARVLMDKIAVMASLIVENNILPREFDSFPAQKNYLKQKRNLPDSINRKYTELIRNKTDWFDISLNFIRNKFIIHTYPQQSAFLVSRERGVRIYSGKILGSSTKDAMELINLKRKYEISNPMLRSIPDNIWEVLHYIQNNDIKFDAQDIRKIRRIRMNNGTDLVEVDYLEKKIFEFLEEFENIFDST